jgi:uncharacterized protein YndB with AHSA1/START domain
MQAFTCLSFTTFLDIDQPQGEFVMDILHRVGIKSSVNEVYKALTTLEGLAAWWTNDTQGDGKVGGVIHFRFGADGADIGGIGMKVVELHPAKQVLWDVVDGPQEWIGTRVHWALCRSVWNLTSHPMRCDAC